MRRRKLRKQDTASTSSVSTWSQLSTRDLELIVEKLKSQCHRDSTRKVYYQIWKQFAMFYQRLDSKSKEWEQRVILFIGHLVELGKQSSTVKTYLSAIWAVLKIDGVVLNEDAFLVNALTRACRITNDRVKTRLPIGKSLLNKILVKTYQHFMALNVNQPYLAVLYKAMFSMAYFGLLWVGEITSGEHPILAKDVQIAANKKKLQITLHTSKTHGKGNLLQKIKISSMSKTSTSRLTQKNNRNSACPYEILREYAFWRGPYSSPDEPFFIFSGKTPVKPYHMRNCLNEMLTKLGKNCKLFSVHNFRIGRCNDLLKLGLSIDSVKRLGRWKSNAIYKYFR